MCINYAVYIAAMVPQMGAWILNQMAAFGSTIHTLQWPLPTHTAHIWVHTCEYTHVYMCSHTLTWWHVPCSECTNKLTYRSISSVTRLLSPVTRSCMAVVVWCSSFISWKSSSDSFPGLFSTNSSFRDSVELHPTQTKAWLFVLVWEDGLVSVAAACNIIIIKQDVAPQK